VEGEEAGLQVPEVSIEASANIMVKVESVCVIAIRRHPPCGWGIALPFIGQERVIYRRAALFSYVWRHGEQCHGVVDRPGESCSSRGVMGCYRSGFEGGGVEVGCPAAVRGPARGRRQWEPVRGKVAGMATSRPRALQ
jgi:hypothetical protein